jgi:hypothetical protein
LKARQSRGSKESNEKLSGLQDSTGKSTKERFSFSQGNAISLDVFNNINNSKKDEMNTQKQKLKTKRSQPNFHNPKKKNIQPLSKKNSVHNFGTYERGQGLIGNVESVKRKTKADENLMRFLGLRESNIMRNSTNEETNEISVIQKDNLHPMLSGMLQISKLEVSQPWDLQTQKTGTEINESMGDMSHLYESHLAESALTRETKIIATHRGESMIEKLQQNKNNRELPIPDLNRRFSKHSIPQADPNLLIFSKKNDEVIQDKKAKLMNQKLDMKYQRMFKKRFDNSKSKKSGNLIDGILKHQMRMRSQSGKSKFGFKLI